MPRKRTHDEMVASEPQAPPQETEMQHKIRNMWEFAALFEYICIFGQAVKIPTIDVEDFEHECTKPEPSQTLEDIGLQLLKWVSSQRALSSNNWDEYTRRQYRDHAPKRNPYGPDDEEPNNFRDFHVFTKLRVLYQLAVWTFRTDRMRQSFDKDTDHFLEWQAHPDGWDRQDRTYYLLQGNRLYRRTDPPIPEPEKVKAKYTSKKGQAQRRKARASRSSKRRRIADSEDGDVDTEAGDADETMNETQIEGDMSTLPQSEVDDPEKIDTYGGYRWECVAVTLDQFESFLATMSKSKDPNEQNLRTLVNETAIPELKKEEEKRQRKTEARLRETQLLEKMQGAKRSGRLAAKQEREQAEAEAAMAERERHTLLAAARKDEERQQKLDHERQSRMLTREQRIKEREYKRILMEEQLARDSEEEKRIEEDGARSSRHLKERIEKHKKELEEFGDDEWTFDCSGCGQYGRNFDDGEHSIACERCNVWQHSKCLGFSKSAAESDDFHFICADCHRKEEEASRPKISLKFKVGPSSSPPQLASSPPRATKEDSPPRQRLVSVDLPPASNSSRPHTNGMLVDGQFNPTPNPFAISLPHQPPVNATQQSVSEYPVKQAQRAAPYTNGVHEHPANFNVLNGYHSQGYNHTTHPHPVFQHPHQSIPHPQDSQSRPRAASSHSRTPRPSATSFHTNGGHALSSPIRQRIPSPIINRPTMSPTQGNPEVGPIAGVPGSSPIMQPALMATPSVNGHYANGVPQSTPAQQTLSQNSSFSAAHQSATQPMSGLSPTKQRISASPLPQPSLVPSKQRTFTTPSSSFNNAFQSRSVSGTPIFPPAENLAPSPQQLNREPVPTPSKQSPPLPQHSSFEVDDSAPPQDQEQERDQQHLETTVQ